MESSTTHFIVESLTRAIVEHRLQPGTKLAEQKLADHFGVSRTLVRQALFQLSRNRLIQMETQVYSMKEGRLVWSGLSESKNPKSAEKLVEEVAGTVAGALRKQGLIE